MRTAPIATAPAALAAALLLAACGTESAGTGGASPTESGSCQAVPSSPDGSGQERSGVRILGLCGDAPSTVTYEITNSSTEDLTYTISFNLTNSAGEAMDIREETVSPVAAGRTVKQALDLDSHEGVSVIKVRSVPASEAAGSAGTCPPSGMRVYADEGDAAMGLRVVGLHLENCGTKTISLNGYPELELLDEEREPVSGVKILHGSGGITSGTDFDAPPGPVILKPGERARSGLMWRNTVEAIDRPPVNAPYARVIARPGAKPATVTPELDLGTTGKLGVSPWKPAETRE